MKLPISPVLLCAAALVAHAASATATPAAAATAAAPMPRLRPATPAADRLIARALRTSPTIQRLASAIAASDLIVYVEFAPLDGTSRATTEFVTATARNRFLRITLDRLAPPSDQIPLLAHELQHAVEIAREPSVRNSAAVRTLYLRIGIDPTARHTFETVQARLAEREARRESFGKYR